MDINAQIYGHGHVEGALLGDDAAGGVVGVDDEDPVPDAGARKDLLRLSGDVVEGADLIVRLHLEGFSVNHAFLLSSPAV